MRRKLFPSLERKEERKIIFLLPLTRVHERVQERWKEGERRVGLEREVLCVRKEKSIA